MSELAVGDLGATAIKVMEAQGKLLEEALRTILLHVPSDEVSINNISGDPHHLAITARGVPMYEVTADMFAVEVTVSGGWLSWPPPQRYDEVELTGSLTSALARRNSKKAN